jgi:hypothetical protein
MEMLLIDPIMFSECSFRLIPKVLNAIDVIAFTASKLFKVIDSEVFKLAHIQCMVNSITISINKAVRLDFTLDNGH